MVLVFVTCAGVVARTAAPPWCEAPVVLDDAAVHVDVDGIVADIRAASSEDYGASAPTEASHVSRAFARLAMEDWVHGEPLSNADWQAIAEACQAVQTRACAAPAHQARAALRRADCLRLDWVINRSRGAAPMAPAAFDPSVRSRDEALARSELAEMDGDLGLALRYLKRAWKSDLILPPFHRLGDDPASLARLARLQVSVGQREDGLELAQLIVDVHPATEGAALARRLLVDGQCLEEPTFERVLALADSSEFGLSWAGTLALARHRFPESFDVLMARMEDPSDAPPGTLSALGVLGDPRALPALRAFAESTPSVVNRFGALAAMGQITGGAPRDLGLEQLRVLRDEGDWFYAYGLHRTLLQAYGRGPEVGEIFTGEELLNLWEDHLSGGG